MHFAKQVLQPNVLSQKQRKNISVGIHCLNYEVLGVNEKRVVIILYLNRGDMTTHKAAEAVYNNTETREILWLTKLQGGLWMVVKGK